MPEQREKPSVLSYHTPERREANPYAQSARWFAIGAFLANLVIEVGVAIWLKEDFDNPLADTCSLILPSVIGGAILTGTNYLRNSTAAYPNIKRLRMKAMMAGACYTALLFGMGWIENLLGGSGGVSRNGQVVLGWFMLGLALLFPAGISFILLPADR